MQNWKLKAVLAAVVACGATSAIAGEITATLAAPPFPVTLSTSGSETLASYRVTLTNTSTSSALNLARLVGTTSVALGAAGAKAVFKTVAGATCTTTNDGTLIDCNVGDLALSESKPFTVTFTTPTSGSAITLTWQAVFNSGGSPGNSNGNAGTTDIPLVAPNPDGFFSDVPANVALTFFTGGGIATIEDPWVTKVKLPSTGTATTAKIEEKVVLTTCAADLLTCSTSTLTIPGTFGAAGASPSAQFLEITLLRDASTIARGAKIESARIYYTTTTDSNIVDFGAEVRSCADGGPQSASPCEDRTQRYAYPRKSTGKAPVPAGFEGDWKFVIYAFDNGRYSN